jgi:hypothetical protein
MNFSSPDKYKPTDLYRSLVDTKKITATTTHEEFKFIPNHKTVAKTWDAKHMDKFIQKSPWGTTNGTLQTHDTTAGSGPQNAKKISSQKSYFFKTGPRFSPKREKEYMFNLFQDISYKEAKNNTNAMVTLSDVKQDVLESHYRKNFASAERHFDTSKLDFTTQANPPMSPRARRNQVTETATEQAEYSLWREKQMQLAKKNRVYKHAYRNGILGLDNPTNDNTLLYRSEHDQLNKFHEERNKIEARRSLQLAGWGKTNPIVEFANKNFDSKLVGPPSKIVAGNGKIAVNAEYTQKWNDTHNRLFTGVGSENEKYSVDRAYKLRNLENRGRKWDAISWANTEISLKHTIDTQKSPSNRVPAKAHDL